MPLYELTPEMVLEIYRHGAFPMAERGDDDAFDIFEAKTRSILPIENLHVSKSLRKKVLKSVFNIRVNTAFQDVIEACGRQTPDRKETWINATIKTAFNQLHRMGHAHSVECWSGGDLVGGLYGLQIGGAFCGESMFSREKDASKVALVHLCARLKKTGFSLLDAQLPNPHLAQFGQLLIGREDYMLRLERAKKLNPCFMTAGLSETQLVYKYLNNEYL